MYEEYFRLTDAPFRLNPDPRFFYGSRSHNKAMAYLHYGLKQAEGFIVITGPVGAGKSMIIGHLLDQLNSSNVVAANLLTSNIEPQDLLSQILSAFRIEPEGEGRTGEIEAFEDYLFDQLNRGRRVLLIIDEAQNLPFKTLEELRMLSNIDYEGTPLFQVFLVGQPEFRAMIESERLEQLRQRVIASYHLEPLSTEETRDYIQHRLSVVGWEDDPSFSDEAFNRIHEESLGLPRRINTLANRVMLYCSLEKTHDVTEEVVKLVAEELQEEKLAAKKAVDPVPPAEKIEVSAEPPDPEIVTAVKKRKAEKKPQKKAAPAAQPEEKESDVVVSIDTAKSKDGIAAEAPNSQEEKEADESPVRQVMASSMSVLDRLRSKKASAEERQEATLNDVASAIAAASETATDGSATRGKDAVAQAPDQPEDAPSWRKTIVKSVEDTQEELKDAHENVLRLKRMIAQSKDARKERRQEISESLSRAESLLHEIRKAQE
ncbi:XrtA-associated ATPase [Hyphococcus flavus]|uniref:XrtA-associated ATPase n=1 Tax=Hyphococcus flavus TaxID=1866326 RepID=A0AAF0CG64_9PROT|nr:XrtA/PEP-CTERM system-associated ATPase [Hyphococcus flavus]WDI32009.1 XrtA-associated ATPase [Hyphococcus flavus]